MYPEVTSKSSLWFVPGRTLQLSDTIDVAILLGAHRYELPMNYLTKMRILLDASTQLTDVDTLLFTHHRDSSNWNAKPCKCIDELVALHSFQPYHCPAHPALRHGSSYPPGRCTCTNPSGYPHLDYVC
mmetsp:Transcript_39926/g.66243  ORF Transcript_39926/g.66243 Transcript_39926/m.66243 type:complete len:128 (+) Transcript_39926:172-555(+)